MKILHIITQKPNSTGSGIYLSGMIKGFEKIGHKQAVIAGIDVNDDVNCFPSEVSFYPVKYNCGELNFPVVGMSDSMPYESTRYKDLNIEVQIGSYTINESINDSMDFIERAEKELEYDV